MDNFIVSARKYRPATFDSVVGQKHITGTLKNAIRNNQLAQAFLFCGPRGVGKTTCARILAKTINCSEVSADTEACGQCQNCQSFMNGTSFSIHELDAASNNSVDDIRSLIEQVRIPPQQGKYKIYIIDEVHMLSQQAFNAFLKTLEEPPSYAIFILATTEKHRILPTILSRCQIFDFNRIRVEDMADHLVRIAEKEGIAYEYDGLYSIAQKADGGLRDALSMFDQIVSFSNKSVTYQAVIENLNILDYDYFFQLTDAINASDAPAALLMFNEILSKGFDGSHFISGLASHFRNLLVAKEPLTVQLLEVAEKIRRQYAEQAAGLSSGLLLSALNVANQCEIHYKTSKNPRLQVELALLKMCHIRSALRLDQQQGTTTADPEKKKLISPPEQTTPEAAIPKAADDPVSVSVPSPAVKENPSEISVVVEKPVTESPVPSTGGGKWSQARLGGSLNQLDDTLFAGDKQQEAKDKAPELIEGTDFAEIKPDTLLLEWHRIADTFKQENKLNLFTLMTSNAPRLADDHKIEVIVENKIQQELLMLSKPDIVNLLRVRLNNYSVNLIGVMTETDTVRKPYTDMEKYQAMSAKNPILEQLRNAFQLGME